MKAGGEPLSTAAAIAGIVAAAAGLGSTIYGLTQDAPEAPKPGLPGSSVSPVGQSSPTAKPPFMGRQNMANNPRQSAALAMLK